MFGLFGNKRRFDVREPDGTITSVSMKVTDTVQALKQKLHEEGRGVVAKQRLLFGGRFLKNDDTLQHCGIEAGSEVQLIFARMDSNNSSQPACATSILPHAVSCHLLLGEGGGSVGSYRFGGVITCRKTMNCTS